MRHRHPTVSRDHSSEALRHAARTTLLLGASVCLFSLASPILGNQTPAPAHQAGMRHSPAPSDPGLLRHGALAPAGARHLKPLTQSLKAGAQGELNLVVILVDFPDRGADRAANTVQYYEDLLFSRDTHPTGSVADFLYHSSGGRLNLTGRVFGWFTAAEDYEFYAAFQNGTIPWVYPYNSQYLAEDAIGRADPYVNYAKFDNEGPDGFPDSGDDDELVDGVVLIAAGTGREGSAAPDELTSIQWSTSKPVPVDGVFGREFTLNPENGNVGVFVHEIGHLLGLPDLYGGSQSFGLGAWSMMSGGSHLGSGVYPADFDAWCKSELGFVEPVRLFSNRLEVHLAPHAEGGSVYRLWTSGGGDKEYFLVENRQARGLDRSLPGSGLFIYHVDEKNTSNGDPRRPLVALEQADGKFSLELRYDNPSFGDSGDPFSPGQSFSPYSYPSSRSNSGLQTHVGVIEITETGDGVLTADLLVEPTAEVSLSHVDWTEVQGDGDGFVGPGETGMLVPHLYIDGLPAFGLEARISPSLDQAMADPMEAEYSIVAVRSLASPEFEITLSEQASGDPYSVDIPLSVNWDGGPPREYVLRVGAGSTVGMEATFADREGWSSYPMHPAAKAPWFFTPSGGLDGSGIYKCGVDNGFPAGIDGALESPVVLLPPRAVLVLDHIFNVIPEDSLLSMAGGFVEVSVNGGEWEVLTPEEGYNGLYHGQHPNVFGQYVWRGALADGQWHQSRFDLSEFSGSARFRFRFLSDLPGPTTGWVLDNVSVLTNPVTVDLTTVDLQVQGDDVVINWYLGHPIPVQVRWLRGPSAAEGEPVGGGWIPGSPSGTIKDVGRAAGLPKTYWFEALERDGTVDRRGPYTVNAAPGGTLRVSLAANPSRGTTPFKISGEVPRGAEIRIFDIQGRLVQRQPIRSAGTWSWDGSTSGGSLACAGIYFAKVVPGRGEALRVVRLR